MNVLFLIYLLSIYLNISYGQDNEGVNEGASTSRELTECEECELMSYADEIVRLVYAEDIDNDSLENITSNRFHELESFHDEVFSNLLLAEYGPRAISDEDFRTQRLVYFIFYAHLKIHEVYMKACTGHHHYSLTYRYDQERHATVVRENINFPHVNCLCENEEERYQLSEEFVLPVLVRPKPVVQMAIGGDRISISELSQYHVIPPALISSFFKYWLMEEEVSPTDYNRCVITLLARLRRSMLKLVIVRIRSITGNSNLNTERIVLDMIDSPFARKLDGRAYDWLRGNIFLGPRERGPFDPEFHKSTDGMRSFEYDAEYILSHEHYSTLHQLYIELTNFVYTDMQLHERLINGFKVFLMMMARMTNYDITPFTENQWLRRTPAAVEMNLVDSSEESDETDREILNKQYWAIKKPPKRSKRSMSYHMAQIENPFSSMNELKQNWRQFIMKLFEISATTSSRQYKRMAWMSNFTYLYRDYLQKSKSLANDDCQICKSFDRYLYSEISKSMDWKGCNGLSDFVVNSEWCQAWTRIRLNSIMDTEIVSALKSKKYASRESLMESYLEDVEIFFPWIITKLLSEECLERENHNIQIVNENSGYMKLPSDPFHRKKTSNIDIALCYFSGLIVHVMTRKSDCRKFF